jgi:hypothetical protein
MIRLQPMIVGVFNFMKTYKNLAKFRLYNKQIKQEKESTFKTYVFYSKRENAYKIGKSTCPESRLKMISKYISDIKIVMVFNVDIEIMFHRVFKDKKLVFYNEREWFLLSKNDIELLNAIKLLINENLQ